MENFFHSIETAHPTLLSCLNMWGKSPRMDWTNNSDHKCQVYVDGISFLLLFFLSYMKEIFLWTISLFHLQREKEKLTAPHIKINQSHVPILIVGESIWGIHFGGGGESIFAARSHWPRQTPILTLKWYNRFVGWVLQKSSPISIPTF